MVGEQGELRGAARGAHAGGQREGKLHSGRAGAHHGDAHRVAAGGRDPLVQPVDEVADRPRCQGVLGHAREGEASDGGTDIEARDVVADRWAPLEIDPPRPRVDARCRGEHDVRSGAARQGHDVDLELVGRVVARNEARHHTRVDGLGAVEHHRRAHAGLGPHHQPAQHLDVGVPAADQDEIALGCLVRSAQGTHTSGSGWR